MAIPAVCETDLIEKIMSQIRVGKDEETIVKEMQNPISVMTINMKSPSLQDANAQQQKDLLSVILRLYPSAIIFCREPPRKFKDVVPRKATFDLKAGENETAVAVVWATEQFNKEELQEEDSEKILDETLNKMQKDEDVRSRLSMVKLTSKKKPPHSTLAVSYHGLYKTDENYRSALTSHLLSFLTKVKKEENDIQSFIVGGDFNLKTTPKEMTSILPCVVTVGPYNLTSRAKQNKQKSSQYIPHKDNFIWSTEIRVDDIEALECGEEYDAAFDHDPVKGKLVLQNQEDRPQRYTIMTMNMNLKSKAVSQEERRQLLSERIPESSPDIIFCQELPGVFEDVAEGYDWVRNGNEAAVMWNHERFEGQVNEVPTTTMAQRDERHNTTLIAIRRARYLLSKISMVNLTRKKSNVRTLAVSYDGRSPGSEKLRHEVFSILVEFLKKVIAENGIDFCIIGGDIGLDTSTVKLLSKTKILSYESDKENDHPCMDYYILRAGGERGVKCVQNIKAVHFETVVEEYILPFSQSSNDGWSNACTIIAVLAAVDFLLGKRWFLRNSLASRLDPDISSYCSDLFGAGNKLYDELDENGDGYSTLEILKHPKLDFKNVTKTKGMYDETHSNFAGFVENLTGLLSKPVKLAFVLIFRPNQGLPVSMVLLINELGESMLIDSHEHSQTGANAIVATAPENELKNMINYIETMVKRHWGLTVSNANRFDVTAVVLKEPSSESTSETSSESTSDSSSG